MLPDSLPDKFGNAVIDSWLASQGRWSLAPAYDVTYAYNPNGLWTGSHQMTVNGKRDGIGFDDMLATAKHMSIKGARSKDIIAQVGDAVKRWNEFADEAKLAEEVAKRIETSFIEI